MFTPGIHLLILTKPLQAVNIPNTGRESILQCDSVLEWLVCLRSMSGSSDPSWAQQDKRRVLFIDIRVQNIEHTQQFYEQHLGMQLWRRLADLQRGQFTSVCGYGKIPAKFHDSLLCCFDS